MVMYKASFPAKIIIALAVAAISLSSVAQVRKFDFEENALKQWAAAGSNRTIYIFLSNGFKNKNFVVPALNEGQKVVRACSATDNQSVEFQLNDAGDAVLSNFKQTDKDVTILAVELNKEVAGNNNSPPCILDMAHSNP
jgi:hypothetical protein